MTLDQPYILSYVKNLSLPCKASCNMLKALLQESETVTCAHTVVTPWLQSPVFPASNALSSSHSRADDRNKGVDPRPVIIIWEGRCKATHFSGLKPRRKGGRSCGWGDWISGAAEATGTVIGRESDWKPNLHFFLRENCSCTLHEHMHNEKCPECWGAPSETGWTQWSSLSICFYPNQYQNMKIFQKKSYYVGRSLWLHNWSHKQLERPDQP